jgi:hypothetical protein
VLLWAREVIRNSIAVRSRQWYARDVVSSLYKCSVTCGERRIRNRSTRISLESSGSDSGFRGEHFLLISVLERSKPSPSYPMKESSLWERR